MDQSSDNQRDSNTDNASDAEAMYTWLEQLLEVQRARLARQAPEDVDSQFKAALDELEQVCYSLRGGVWQWDALTAVHKLIATGIVWWQHSMKKLPKDPSAPWILSSIARGALWPLVPTHNMPDGWFAALQSISSLEVAVLVSDTRFIAARGDVESHKVQFQQTLAGSHYLDGIVHILDDLHDESGGWPSLEILMTSPDGIRPEKPKDRIALLVLLIGGASFVASAAAQGVIGNAVYDLVKQIVRHLTSTPSPLISPVTIQSSALRMLPIRHKGLLLDMGQGVNMEFIRVPAGEFLMGSDPAKDKDAQEREQPQHHAYVSEFHIGKYPVTNVQFTAFVEVTHYQTTAEKEDRLYNWQHPQRKDSDIARKQNHPVVQVTWDDAVAFCEWLSQETGYTIRLPTEAEWEKAARGTNGRIYPGSNIWDKKRLSIANDDTTPVGKYSPDGDSPYGAADMAGNVWEWCADWYNADEYQAHRRSGLPVKDPTGPSKGKYRVVRGGSWDFISELTRAAYRYRYPPSYSSNNCGFRVVATPIP